jgi:hypothetical protein
MKGNSFVRYGYAPEGDRKGHLYISVYQLKVDRAVEPILWRIVSCIHNT